MFEIAGGILIAFFAIAFWRQVAAIIIIALIAVLSLAIGTAIYTVLTGG